MSDSVIALLRERASEIRFLLDSGAFTAWKLGQLITVDDYCNFIERLPFKPWRYFSLDVIGDAKATRANYETMLKRGFTPVPIFTRGETPSVLDEYYSTSDAVGIGGLVGTQGNKGFVKGIMKHVGARRVHLLGFTSLPFLKAYRPYMCDSSSWETGARFATIALYVGKGSRLISLTKANARTLLRDQNVYAAIAREGLEPDALLHDVNWQGGKSVARRLAARSARRLSEEVGEKLGTHYFLAATTNLAVATLLGAEPA